MEQDEIQSVNRRDAIAGLGALGVLLIALVGTIFYRIVNPSPAEKISLEELVLAPEIEAANVPWATQFPTAQPNTALELDSNVSSAGFDEESQAPVNAAAAHPTFIAPAGR